MHRYASFFLFLTFLVGLMSAGISSVITFYLTAAYVAEDSKAGWNTLTSTASQLAALTSAALSRNSRLATTLLAATALSPSVCILGLVLRASLSLAQALGWPPTEPARCRNVFTDQLTANCATYSTDITHAMLHPASQLFTALNVLLLYLILCPLAFLIGLHQPHRGGDLSYRCAHFIVVRTHTRPRRRPASSNPLVSPRLLLMTATFIAAAAWDHFTCIQAGVPTGSTGGPSTSIATGVFRSRAQCTRSTQ